MLYKGDSLIEKLLDALRIDPNGGALRIASAILISLGIILIFGFLMTRLTKLLRLPNVTAYIVVGILIGPSIMFGPNIKGIIPGDFIEHTSFVSDIALAFIAFSAGEFFKINKVKKNIGKSIIITVFEAVFTFVLTFVLCRFAFSLGTPFSLIIAALTSATAPTSTIMTIKQTKAKGHYVDTLLEVIVLDGVIALLLYTVSISLFVATEKGSLEFMDIAWPLLTTLICLAIGVAFGFILKFLISFKRTTDNRLIIVIATLLLFCGICTLFGQSPLLGAIAIGTVYSNMCKTDDERKLFAQVNYFIPPIMLVFFVRGGMSLQFSIFSQSNTISSIPLIVIVIAVLLARLAGKYGGSYVGGVVTSQPKETRNFLGLGLLPQASIAIALATMGVRTLESKGFDEYASFLLAVILASSIIFELVAPALAKLGLYLSHSFESGDGISRFEDKSDENAYTEAAVEHYDDWWLK